MSKLQERQKNIYELIKENRYMRVKDLAEHFHVSQETIRRDLEDIEKLGVIKKSHGAVSYKTSVSYNVDFKDRQIKNLEEKKSIAKRAAMLIEEKDVVAILGSTTTLQMASYIRDKNNLVVITNDLQIGAIVGENDSNKVIFLGGQYVPIENCTMGIETVTSMGKYYPDKVFFASTGISLQEGITSYTDFERNLIQVAIRNATESYHLCDYTKFEKKGMYATIQAENLTGIITDFKTPFYVIEGFRQQGVQIFVARDL